MKELDLMRSRVEELEQEQKSSHETIGQLSAQRDELKRSHDQHSHHQSALRTVSRAPKELIAIKKLMPLKILTQAKNYVNERCQQ